MKATLSRESGVSHFFESCYKSSKPLINNPYGPPRNEVGTIYKIFFFFFFDVSHESRDLIIIIRHSIAFVV